MRSFWRRLTGLAGTTFISPAFSFCRGTLRLFADRGVTAALLSAIFVTQCSVGEQGKDVDLSTAIPLLAVPAPTPSQFQPGEEPGSPAVGVPDTVPVNNLFNLPPGQFAAMSRMAGVIDPVGTSLPQDFDGDGILNDNETVSNRWIADYPVVQAKIATPVTLKIEILESTTQSDDEIVSEITSDDYEDTVNNGTEKAHRNEVNERTAQFQDSISNANSLSIGQKTSTSFGASSEIKTAGMIGPSVAFSASGSASRENTWSNTNSFSETRTKWADIPFKNNLDRSGWQLKSETAAQKARKFRNELRQKVDATSVVDANAGYVRAALYIENLSINMPVRLSNILCSLMFETPEGELVPVQSFILRNDDYSTFSVDVYGGTQFGPYVIELSNLNTSEIKKAIASGYNPRIFIADYDMTHVPDSNYRSALLNFSGDNLKIVEENAKGRTGLVRIIGPGIREVYRVAAFDTDGTDPDVCHGDAGAMAAPGISLEKALERIACSGLNIEFENYVIDMSGDGFPSMEQPLFHLRGVRSVGSHATTLPCVEQTVTGSDSVSRTACVQKPVEDWTEAEKLNAGIWVVFADGRYYAHTEYIRDGGNIRTFNSPAPGELEIPMVKGIDSTLWVGDTFDIVYLTYKELEEVQVFYGTNPLETGEVFTADTLWDSSTIGDNAFDPDLNSKYLGVAGFGEEIEVAFRLTETEYLNPDFGTGLISGSQTIFTNFSYDQSIVSDRFSMNEVADFEISLGFGGERSDWMHITKDLNGSDSNKPASCGDTLDYVEQVFYKCVRLPTTHPVVDPEIGAIKVYIRPALNSGYRNTIWPLAYTDVRRFRALATSAYSIGDTILELDSAIGSVSPGDVLYFEGDSIPYSVNAVAENSGIITVTLSTGLGQDLAKDTLGFVTTNLSAPTVEFAMDSTFLADWNLDALDPPDSVNWRSEEKADLLAANSHSCSLGDFNPVKCLGFATDYIAGNWMGGNNHGVPNWNAWADAGKFYEYLSSGLPAIQAGSGKTMSFQAPAADTRINTSVAGDQTNTRVVVVGKRALSVWRSGTDLRARLIDLDTGSTLQLGDFLLNDTTPSSIRFDVSVSENSSRAIVVWEADTTAYVYARVFDMVAGTLVGSEISVFAAAADQPEVASWNSTALVSFFDPATQHMQARFLDLSAGTVDGATFQVSVTQGVTTCSSACKTDIAGGAGRAIIGWTHEITTAGNNESVRARVYDMTTKSALTGEVIVKNGLASAPDVHAAVVGDRALVAWQESTAPSYKYLLHGQVLSMQFGSLVGSDLLLDAADIGTPYEVAIAGAGNRAVVVFNNIFGAADLYAATVDLYNGTLVNSLSIGGTAGAQMSASVVAKDDRAYVVYETEAYGAYEIVGLFMDLTTGTVSESDFIVNVANYGSQLNPAIAIDPASGDGYIAWESNDNTNDFDIRGRVADIDQKFKIKYGLNNFFTAPLIRRKFEVQALIKLDP
ncbi:MAG: LIC12048 family lipoprotein [bacterium]|nr:LIC12048 family lipoprotein [bacterium]